MVRLSTWLPLMCLATVCMAQMPAAPVDLPFINHLFGTSVPFQALLQQYLQSIPSSHQTISHATRFASLIGNQTPLETAFRSKVLFKIVLKKIIEKTVEKLTAPAPSSISTSKRPSEPTPNKQDKGVPLNFLSSGVSTVAPRPESTEPPVTASLAPSKAAGNSSRTIQKPAFCGSGCESCPIPHCLPCDSTVAKCPPCQPCPAPPFCKEPAEGQRCPPKPNCPVCLGSPRASTSPPKSASLPPSHTPDKHFSLPISEKIDKKSSISSSGASLLEKNLELLIPDKAQRELLRKVFDEIPTTTGGEEARLAQQVLASFGEKQAPQNYQTRTARGRTISFTNARTNAKAIMGHLFESYRRNKCGCPQCSLREACVGCPLSHIKCPTKSSKTCKPCPTHVCPVPPKCPELPPCPKCPEEEDPDYNGDLKKLDDIDEHDPIKDKELDQTVPCKGFTCGFQKTCGIADLNPLTPKGSQSGYMHGGEDEIYGEYPAYVRLDIRQNGAKLGLCGGVLISDRHVLTAHHCVIKTASDKLGSPTTRIHKSDLKVVIGDYTRSKKDEYEQEVGVENVCYAKKFSEKSSGTRHDFALLTLDKKVNFNNYVQPACLPYKPINLRGTSKCFAVGIGVTNYTSHGVPNFAEHVQKMRVKRTSCKVWGFRHDDRSRHCFTKYGAEGDTCAGDSGGPVLCLNSNKRWTVVGLVSYGSESCDGTESVGWIAVYTRIQALLKELAADCGV